MTRVLGKQSQSILKGRGGNQRVRNHQSVAKSGLLDQNGKRCLRYLGLLGESGQVQESVWFG